MGVDCVDVPAPGVGAMCGPCPQGYRGDGSKCAGKLSLHVHVLISLWEFDKLIVIQNLLSMCIGSHL